MKNKIINYLLWISLSLFVIFLTLLILNENIKIPYEIRNTAIKNLYFRAPFYLILIVCVLVVIKSFKADAKRWTRWVPFGFFTLLLLLSILLFIDESKYIRIEEIIMFSLIGFFGLGGALTMFFIKKLHVTKWISFGLFIILSGFCLISSIAASLDKEYIFTDDYILYENLENPRLMVIKQSGKYYTTRTRIIKNTNFFVRYSTPFTTKKLNGRWKGFDEFGNAITINTYENGVIVKREPVLPENAELINTSDSLLLLAAEPGKDRYICLEGDFLVERALKIKGAKNITIVKPGNIDMPLINSNYNNHTSIVLENCENVIIDSIAFSLCSKYNKEPGIINIINCSSIMIKNCYITGNAKYAIYVDEKSSNIIIRYNNISDYKSHGVYLSADNTWISDNQFTKADERDYYTDFKAKKLKLTQDDYLQLIKSALEESDEYAFAGGPPELTVSNVDFTTFLGGPADLYYYVGIYNSMVTYFTERYGDNASCRTGYCANLFYKLSGIHPFITEKSMSSDKWGWDEYGALFKHVNPDFVDWIGDNMILPPERKIAGTSLQEIYNYIFSRFFQLMTETYLYLQKNFDIDEAVNNYKYAADEYTVQYHLSQTYSGVLNKYNVENFVYYEDEGEYYDEYDEEYDNGEYYDSEGEYYEDYYDYYYPYYMTQADCVGFWLRRIIDGSADKIFKVLAKFMETYDSEWFEGISVHYGYAVY